MKAFSNALDFTIEMSKRIRFCDKMSKKKSKFVKKHYDRHSDQSKLKRQKALDLLRKFT